MADRLAWRETRDILLEQTKPIGTEIVALKDACGRILAADVVAVRDVPPFDRSPYDGYALRSGDTAKELPVTLRILEEIPAGSVPTKKLEPMTAAKILTGAPVPEGCDCTIKYEDTIFDGETVTVSKRLGCGENLIRAGEDIKTGQLLIEAGRKIDAGAAGALASQGIGRVEVFKTPKVGVIPIGSELVEPEEEIKFAQIPDSGSYAIRAALEAEGLKVTVYSAVKDDVSEISAMVDTALKGNDAVITTGGVSVGDYDLTKRAYEKAAVKILCGDLALKPGGKSWYGLRDKKFIFGLSGNPASAMTNFYAVVLPCIRKLRGDTDGRLPELYAVFAEDFKKQSKQTRLLRGRLIIKEDKLMFAAADKQGNAAVHTLSGANALAEIPAGSGPVKAGETVKVHYFG